MKTKELIANLLSAHISKNDDVEVDDVYSVGENIFYSIKNSDLSFTKNLNHLDLNKVRPETIKEVLDKPLTFSERELLDLVKMFNITVNGYNKNNLFGIVESLKNNIVLRDQKMVEMTQSKMKNDNFIDLFVNNKISIDIDANLVPPREPSERSIGKVKETFDVNVFYSEISSREVEDYGISLRPNRDNLNKLIAMHEYTLSSFGEIRLTLAAAIIGLLAYIYKNTSNMSQHQNRIVDKYYNEVFNIKRVSNSAQYTYNQNYNGTPVASDYKKNNLFNSVYGLNNVYNLGTIGKALNSDGHYRYYSWTNQSDLHTGVEINVDYAAMSDSDIVLFEDLITSISNRHAQYVSKDTQALENLYLFMGNRTGLGGKKSSRLTLERWFNLEALRQEKSRRNL